MRLATRLRRLEVMAQLASPICMVCGHDPNATPRLRLADEHDDMDGPDSCPACGRLLRLRLTFDERD